MSSRRTKKDSGRHTSDIDDDGSMAAKEKSCATNGGKATSGKGLNYTAIILMGMLILPGIFAAFMQIVDIFYPEAKVQRVVRDRVNRCYEAANPSKLSEVDSILRQYVGREHVLMAKLGTKYSKFPECQ